MDEKQGDALSKMRCNSSVSCLLVVTLLDSEQSKDLACNPHHSKFFNNDPVNFTVEKALLIQLFIDLVEIGQSVDTDVPVPSS